MKRTAALRTVVEEAERMIMTERQTELSAAEIKGILHEVVRSELGRIIDGLDVQLL